MLLDSITILSTLLCGSAIIHSLSILVAGPHATIYAPPTLSQFIAQIYANISHLQQFGHWYVQYLPARRIHWSPYFAGFNNVNWYLLAATAFTKVLRLRTDQETRYCSYSLFYLYMRDSCDLRNMGSWEDRICLLKAKRHAMCVILIFHQFKWSFWQNTLQLHYCKAMMKVWMMHKKISRAPLNKMN